MGIIGLSKGLKLGIFFYWGSLFGSYMYIWLQQKIKITKLLSGGLHLAIWCNNAAKRQPSQYHLTKKSSDTCPAPLYSLIWYAILCDTGPHPAPQYFEVEAI
jgi:hypothetical protein